MDGGVAALLVLEEYFWVHLLLYIVLSTTHMLLLYKTLPRASAGLLRRFSAASSPLSNLGSAVSHLSLEEINKALPDLLEADQTDKHLADLCAYL